VRIGPQERAKSDQQRARDQEEEALVVAVVGQDPGDHERHADRRSEPSEDRVARLSEQPERLVPGTDGEDQHHGGDRPPSQEQRNDQKRDRDCRSRDALGQHGRAYSPKRRARRAYSVIASSRASGPKSGHSAGVLKSSA
jgi:hypothetical protein